MIFDYKQNFVEAWNTMENVPDYSATYIVYCGNIQNISQEKNKIMK